MFGCKTTDLKQGHTSFYPGWRHSGGHHLLGAQQRSWQEKWGWRKAAKQHGMWGASAEQGHRHHWEQNQKMHVVARSTRAKPLSPCHCHPTLKACSLSQKLLPADSRLLLLYSQPNCPLLDIKFFTYPHCTSLFQEAMHLNLKGIT